MQNFDRLVGGLGCEADQSQSAAESLMVLNHGRGCRQAVPHGGCSNHKGSSVCNGGGLRGDEPDVGPTRGHRLGSGLKVRLERDSYGVIAYLVHHAHSGLGSPLLERQPFQAFPHSRHTSSPPPIVASKMHSFVLHSLYLLNLGLVPLMCVLDSRGVLRKWANKSCVHLGF